MLPAWMLLSMSVGACHQDPIEIVPEFDLSYSFESGMEGWEPAAFVAGGSTWSVQRSTEEASQGAASLRLALDDAGGQGTVVVVRELEVEPDRAYRVTVSLDLGTTDRSGTDPWRVVAAADSVAPETVDALVPRGGTDAPADPAQGVAWVGQEYTFTATGGPDGYLFVSLGIQASAVASRIYYLDNVRLVLMRG